jgi:hypothetical protein
VTKGPAPTVLPWHKVTKSGEDYVVDEEETVPTGRFIRNIHRWSANLMVVAVLLHMVRAFYTGAYRSPREFNWLIGLGLLVVTLGLSFTGYLLPWDQLAYWAITIGANIAQSPREVTDAIGITETFDPGGLQRQLLLGSDIVGEEALIRFYLLHVMILPLLLLILLAVHFWRIRKDGGLTRPEDADDRLGPHHRILTRCWGAGCRPGASSRAGCGTRRSRNLSAICASGVESRRRRCSAPSGVGSRPIRRSANRCSRRIAPVATGRRAKAPRVRS